MSDDLNFDSRAIPPDVLGVCQRLRGAGFEAFLVGGGVRDLLLGRPPADFDVATNAHPPQVMALFGSRFAIPTGLQHGTVTVITDSAGGPRQIEVTTYRGEGAYIDGRRPSAVTYVGSLEEDLSRRDFTMNAVGFDPLSGELRDPFAGRVDMAARRIRAVGDPVARFREDGLRPMRAVRQAAIALGERPDEAITPADRSPAGRAGAKLQTAIGAFGEWFDGRR